MRDRTTSAALIAAVTDIRCTGKTAAVFLIKVTAMLVAVGTGSAFDSTQLDLFANIRKIAMKAFRAEVMSIEKEALSCMIIRHPVLEDLLGNGRWILAQITRDVFERDIRIQTVFNVQAVFNSKVFMVAGDIFTHDALLPLLSEQSEYTGLDHPLKSSAARRGMRIPVR